MFGVTSKTDRLLRLVLLVLNVIHLGSDLISVMCIVIDTKEQLESNMCRMKNCTNYDKCKIDENTFMPKCYCSNECDTSNEIEYLSENVSDDDYKQDVHLYLLRKQFRSITTCMLTILSIVNN